MKCDRCREQTQTGEEMEHNGQNLCEECYMQVLSPIRACDPWAVRSAQVLSEIDENYSTLSKPQENILRIIIETRGIEPGILAKKLQIKIPELEKELATLRHMEKVRGEMRDGKKIINVWKS